MKDRLRKFMYGRYGIDHLGRLLNIFILILIVLSFLIRPFAIISLTLLVFQYFRIFSRNISKRSRENGVYIALRNRIKGWFTIRWQQLSQRNTHRYYKCPSCRQTLRVPKGKGKIAIKCPKCNNQFEKKT